MSTRRLRARLDRLEQSADNTIVESEESDFEFTIDPTLANAIRDDCERLGELKYERFFKNEEETEEERKLRARIAEKASTISCQAGYGFNEMLADKFRISQLSQLVKAETDDIGESDDKRAKIIARIEAYNQTPEGQERTRLEELEHKIGWKSEAEHNELIRLLTRYPEPVVYQKDPFFATLTATRLSLEERKKDAEHDKVALEKAKRLRQQNTLEKT